MKTSQDILRETLIDLKLKSIAFDIANEYGAVPNIKELDDVCEVFGDENKDLYIQAMRAYEGYSDSDLSSAIIRTLQKVEI